MLELTEITTKPALVMAPIINMLVTIIRSMFRESPWQVYKRRFISKDLFRRESATEHRPSMGLFHAGSVFNGD